MSAVAVVSIALVCTGVLYYERWLVTRDARARARERWQRVDLLDPDYGRHLRTLPLEPLARIIDAAVWAADLAAAYQRRFDATFRGRETPFEFKRGRVRSAFDHFETMRKAVAQAAEQWLEEHAERRDAHAAHRDVIARVLELGHVQTSGSLATMETSIAVLENARRSLYRLARPSREGQPHPFRATHP